jgi:hypothetical protein
VTFRAAQGDWRQRNPPFHGLDLVETIRPAKTHKKAVLRLK